MSADDNVLQGLRFLKQYLGPLVDAVPDFEKVTSLQQHIASYEAEKDELKKVKEDLESAIVNLQAEVDKTKVELCVVEGKSNDVAAYTKSKQKEGDDYLANIVNNASLIAEGKAAKIIDDAKVAAKKTFDDTNLSLQNTLKQIDDANANLQSIVNKTADAQTALDKINKMLDALRPSGA